MPLQALVFDFDGTILDTETPEFEAWCRVYADHGCDPDVLPLDRWADSIGRGPEQAKFDPHTHLETHLGRTLERDALRLHRRGYYLAAIERLPPRPGVEAYLREGRARGLRLAVASSSDRAWVTGHLRRLGLLDYFNTIRTCEDVTRTKPDPELYLSAVAALGVEAAQTIAFEDSPNGVRAAVAAGVVCVATPNPLTAPLDFTHAHLRVDNLAALPLADLLAKLEGDSVLR